MKKIFKKYLIIIISIGLTLLILTIFILNRDKDKQVLDSYYLMDIDDIFKDFSAINDINQISKNKFSNNILEIALKKIELKESISREEYNKLISSIGIKENKTFLDKFLKFNGKDKFLIQISKLDMHEKEKLFNIICYYSDKIRSSNHNSLKHIEIDEKYINKIDWGYDVVFSKEKLYTKEIKADNTYMFKDKKICFGNYYRGKRNSFRIFFSSKILEVKKEVDINQEKYLLRICCMKK